MIPAHYLETWKDYHFWKTYEQTEQDLVIERAVCEIFADDFLREHLAFRGGTALHKLYLSPQIRYSEDIDLVQISSEPINPILKRIRERLSFLGTKRIVKQHIHNNTIIYRFDSEMPPVIPLKLKIEINTREHFNVLPLVEILFEVKNGWFSGTCNINCYQLEELLGTKLRALYQRRKGRDLFDLYYALTHKNIDCEKVVECFKQYIAFSVEKPPTQKQFLANMEEKITMREFIEDTFLILNPNVDYNHETAWETVKNQLVETI
ncbi:MAG: nucleotidyl transferase AbiEii/AbiGii toxin family protein [Prevotellaceae bacterium]|jgi:predicted nucleotidyltransferase component of viral defense system|nr:nucleotidyl transferase AbiEii/AbiGii toxin family protein [Prevotellaceae bacterium]